MPHSARWLHEGLIQLLAGLSRVSPSAIAGWLAAPQASSSSFFFELPDSSR